MKKMQRIVKRETMETNFDSMEGFSKLAKYLHKQPRIGVFANQRTGTRKNKLKHPKV